MSHDALSKEMLEEITGRILEEAAFIFTERSDESWGETETVLRAEVSFSGLMDGKLIVGTTLGFAQMLAANLLGLDADDEGVDNYSDDAVSELTNMIGGELLAHWLGATSKYEMGVPRVERTKPDEQKRAMATTTCWVPMLGDDEYRIDVAVTQS